MPNLLAERQTEGYIGSYVWTWNPQVPGQLRYCYPNNAPAYKTEAAALRAMPPASRNFYDHKVYKVTLTYEEVTDDMRSEPTQLQIPLPS